MYITLFFNFCELYHTLNVIDVSLLKSDYTEKMCEGKKNMD